MTLNVLVKGTREQALQAAMKRKIPVQAVQETMSGYEEVTLEISDLFQVEVVNWLTEPGSAPFLPGTCLFYSDKVEDDRHT